MGGAAEHVLLDRPETPGLRRADDAGAAVLRRRSNGGSTRLRARGLSGAAGQRIDSAGGTARYCAIIDTCFWEPLPTTSSKTGTSKPSSASSTPPDLKPSNVPPGPSTALSR